MSGTSRRMGTSQIASVSPIMNNQNVGYSMSELNGNKSELKSKENTEDNAKLDGKNQSANSQIQTVSGLEDAIVKENWGDCVKLLKKSIGFNSPEVKQLQYVKEYSNMMDIAFEKGYKDLIILLIHNGYPVNKVVNGDKKIGNPLLLLPLKYDLLELTHLLLHKNANVNCKGISGETPLHVCAEKGLIDILKILISKNVDVTAIDKYHRSALHCAVLKNQFDVVKLLLEKQVDIDFKDSDGKSVLHRAVLKKQCDIIKLLLNKDIDTDLQDKRGYTALHISVANGYEDIFTMLHERGASINTRNNSGETPLITAVREHRTSIAKSLLDDPYCDTEVKIHNGYTAFLYAEHLRYYDITNIFRAPKTK